MTDFKEGGVPTPDYDTDDINFISQKTEFTDDVFVYGKLYADLGGNVQTFSTAGVERIRITKDGRVGIGTDNPQCILDINKDISGGVNNVDIRNHHPSGGAALRVKTQGTYGSPTYQAILGASDAGDTIRVGAVSNHPLLLLVNNQEKLRITENGLVKGTLLALIGEHNGATAVGELFSFGNGSNDNHGPAMPFDGQVIVVTISKSGGSNAGIFQPSKNGATQGSASDQITTTTGSGSVTKNNADYTSLMDFNAGDRINYVTIDAADTSTCLTMLVRFNPI